jgi:hypothetical protein
MKTHDSQFVQKTMQQLVSMEKKRSTRFLLVVRGLLVLFVGVVLGFSAHILYQLSIQGSFDVLSILSEDREIIREYWGDVMFVFLSEFPTDYIPVILAAICIGIGTYVITIRSRRRSSRVLEDIRSIEKKNVASSHK